MRDGSKRSETACVAITIAKPGCEEKVLEALLGLIDTVRQEKGFIQYDLHRDQDDSRRFVLVERWDSREEFDAHCVAPHINEYLEETQEWIESGVFYPLTRLA